MPSFDTLTARETSVGTAGLVDPLTLDEARRCCERYGDSFYVFYERVFRNNYLALQKAFKKWYPDTKIAYSYKTNYTPAVCKLVSTLGGYAEVVSEMEFDLARSLGVDGPKIIYNGPCKSFVSLQKAVEVGALVNIDSIQDYRNLKAIASTLKNREVMVGIRCNFAMAGRELSRFGIDINSEDFREVTEGIRSTRNLVLGGLHCHFSDRDLESFRQRTKGLIEVVQREFPSGLQFIDIGGGFFGELPESLQVLCKGSHSTFSDYGEAVGSLCAEAFGHLSPPPTLFIEPGTGLVANTFRFYTRVLNIRNIGAQRVATVAGSIQNISPNARCKQLPVRVLALESTGDLRAADSEVDIGGYTCMESDYLTKGLQQQVFVGDLLEYANVGSYSIVMKPPFILPNVPILMMAGESRAITVIRNREDVKALFHSFIVPEKYEA